MVASLLFAGGTAGAALHSSQPTSLLEASSSLTPPSADAALNVSSLSIDGGMPAHAHGLPTEPQLAENLGGGQYRVEGMRFNMGGHWEIRIGISADPGLDEAVFNLDL